MSNDVKAEIRTLSSQAARVSKNAVSALKAGNFEQGKTLIKQAVDAASNCQKLIQKSQLPSSSAP